MLRRFLRPGEFYVSRQPAVVETLVGSCVTVCLYNAAYGFGAMNHFLRARPLEARTADRGTYGTTATQYVVGAVTRRDAEPRHYHASIFGGAAVLSTGPEEGGVGETNIEVARAVLREAGIRVARAEVGGTRGRRVTFNTETGEIECRFAGDIPRKRRSAGPGIDR
jgi:chemotaxis protein CheD